MIYYILLQGRSICSKPKVPWLSVDLNFIHRRVQRPMLSKMIFPYMSPWGQSSLNFALKRSCVFFPDLPETMLRAVVCQDIPVALTNGCYHRLW